MMGLCFPFLYIPLYEEPSVKIIYSYYLTCDLSRILEVLPPVKAASRNSIARRLFFASLVVKRGGEGKGK